jgi:thiamine biosynthesis protein ThiS
VQITANGKSVELQPDTTILGLLQILGLSGPVAVERNREIVPRSAHSTTQLKEGDQLEIVQLVGGG